MSGSDPVENGPGGPGTPGVILGAIATVIRLVCGCFALVLVGYVLCTVGQADPSRWLVLLLGQWAGELNLGLVGVSWVENSDYRTIVAFGGAALGWLLIGYLASWMCGLLGGHRAGPTAPADPPAAPADPPAAPAADPAAAGDRDPADGPGGRLAPADRGGRDSDPADGPPLGADGIEPPAQQAGPGDRPVLDQPMLADGRPDPRPAEPVQVGPPGPRPRTGAAPE